MHGAETQQEAKMNLLVEKKIKITCWETISSSPTSYVLQTLGQNPLLK